MRLDLDATNESSCHMSLRDAKHTVDNMFKCDVHNNKISIIRLLREIYRVAFERGRKAGMQEMLSNSERYIEFCKEYDSKKGS